jgi:hypothetical protein
MSENNKVQGSGDSYPQEQGGDSRLFLVAAALLVGVLLFTITGQLSKEGRTGGNSVGEAVVYGDALERQYAQPWIDKEAAVQYSDTLAMQYARPWLERPVVYGNALELAYAQPWLKGEQVRNCIGRLDMMYACQNGYRLP